MFSELSQVAHPASVPSPARPCPRLFCRGQAPAAEALRMRAISSSMTGTRGKDDICDRILGNATATAFSSAENYFTISGWPIPCLSPHCQIGSSHFDLVLTMYGY